MAINWNYRKIFAFKCIVGWLEVKVGRHDLVASGQSRAMRYREGGFFFVGGPGPPGSQRVKVQNVNFPRLPHPVTPILYLFLYPYTGREPDAPTLAEAVGPRGVWQRVDDRDQGQTQGQGQGRGKQQVEEVPARSVLGAGCIQTTCAEGTVPMLR